MVCRPGELLFTPIRQGKLPLCHTLAHEVHQYSPQWSSALPPPEVTTREVHLCASARAPADCSAIRLTDPGSSPGIYRLEHQGITGLPARTICRRSPTALRYRLPLPGLQAPGQSRQSGNSQKFCATFCIPRCQFCHRILVCSFSDVEYESGWACSTIWTPNAFSPLPGKGSRSSGTPCSSECIQHKHCFPPSVSPHLLVCGCFQHDTLADFRCAHPRARLVERSGERRRVATGGQLECVSLGSTDSGGAGGLPGGAGQCGEPVLRPRPARPGFP
jgi:hypothetical protein